MIAMPDIHWGYGFPIGGVAAMGMAIVAGMPDAYQDVADVVNVVAGAAVKVAQLRPLGVIKG